MHYLCLVALGSLLSFSLNTVFCGKYEWMKYDKWDEISDQYVSIQKHNCRSKPKDDLFLRGDTVAQRPVFNRLRSEVWYANRTALVHLHNMALNRAFFFSYINQKTNSSQNFDIMPNWLYMYMSVTADVNANPFGFNASAIYFDTNCTYPNWYTTVDFNRTLPLFAPKAWRWDDWVDQDNYLREPTRQVVMVTDVGSGRSSNYTVSGYKMNPWYQNWLPDLTGESDSLNKFTYHVGIKYSNETGKFTHNEFLANNFFGPNSPGQSETQSQAMPVMWTDPYYDCGKQNRFVLSATAPIVDYMPRYSNFTHLRRARFVGVISMDIDFNKIDFNACPVSVGNRGPSYLSGVDRCKKKTTSCKHKSGFGFKRGGYVCVCRAGYRFPMYTRPPFQGLDVEQATEEEYKDGFECLRVGERLVPSVVGNNVTITLEGFKGPTTFRRRRLASIDSESSPVQEKDQGPQIPYGYYNIPNIYPQTEEMTVRKLTRGHVQKIRKGLQNGHRRFISRRTMTELKEYWQDNYNATQKRRKRDVTFDEKGFDRMLRLMRQLKSITPENCHSKPAHLLYLPGDVAYGVNKQFEPEGRTALRLAHFISNYLQNTAPDENFGDLRGGGRLHYDHLFGEVLANVMGNYKIYSSGVYFDRHQFVNKDETFRELFGPLAYRKDGIHYAIDTAGLKSRYVAEDWFREQKSRWGTNAVGLKEYKMRANIRSDAKGSSTVRHEYYPISYRAAAYSDGVWRRPVFKCDGRVDAWVVTYVVPFFGYDRLRKNIKFKGVVTVDVPLEELEINQCPQPFYVPNAFKNTARCHQMSTRCTQNPGYKFMRGAYKCACREGFEYYHMDNRYWIEGFLLEVEWEKKIRGLFSKFDQLHCRIAGGSVTSFNFLVIISSVFISLMS